MYKKIESTLDGKTVLELIERNGKLVYRIHTIISNRESFSSTYQLHEFELALECLNKNARCNMDALQIDNMNRSARGGLIGE